MTRSLRAVVSPLPSLAGPGWGGPLDHVAPPPYRTAWSSTGATQPGRNRNAPGLTSRAFLLSPTDRDFSDTERDLPLLLLPHLEAAYRRVGLTARLSEREREILSLIAKGMTNREIGEALYLSPLTVRTHLEHIFAKRGVRTRTAAAAFAPEASGRSVSAGV